MPFDTTLDPTTDVILGAIDHLQRYGWIKGYSRLGIARCIKGALLEKTGANNRLFDAAIRRVKKANGIEIDLAFWNDAQDRTKEQVIDAMRNSLVAGWP